MELPSDPLPYTPALPTALVEQPSYNIDQAATLLGVSRVSIWRWIRDGRLPAARLGHRTTRITRADLEHLLTQRGSSGFRSPGQHPGKAATSGERAAGTDWWSVGPTEHIVQFYDADVFLIDKVSEFIGVALRTGDSGIVVATPPHRSALEERLEAQELDLAGARAQGRYVALDAAETLARLLVAGTPRPEQFTAVIGELIAGAAISGCRVRVFGEMAALLVGAGNHAAALRLEDLWNELQTTRPFALFCAYPLAGVAGTVQAAHMGSVCMAHSRVIPAEGYTALNGDDRLRAIALLQQKAHSLEAEIAERTRIEQDLRCAEEERRGLLDAEQRARATAEAALARLRAVQSVSDAALAHLSTPNLLKELLARLVEVLGVDNAAILVPTEDNQQLLLYLARGPEEQVAGKVRVPFGQGIAGTIAATRQPLVVEDLSTAEVANPFLKQTIHSLMGIPLLLQDRLVGVLHAGTVAPRRFTEDDLLLLRLVGDRISLALEHARLFADQLAARTRLQQVLDVLPEGVVVADASSSAVVAMNRAAEELLGAQVVGQPVPIPPLGAHTEFAARLLDGTPFPVEELPLARALLRGETVRAEQFLIRNARSGQEVAILANSAPLRDDQGAIAGAVEVFQDISALKELERQREQFLATVSHDLKNPLTSILGMSQLLELRARRLAEPDQARFTEGLGAIGETARRMAQQINELLDITRMQMGQPLHLELAPTDVVALVARLVAEYQRTTERHTLRLESSVDTLISMVDPERLQRALANLLSNAIKYSPQGGELHISIVYGEDQAGPWFTISVADQGLGIPREEVDQVFEGFYRASNVMGQFAGTGLGLKGVRQIVERHGGTVALDSTEGVGTRVTIRLPRHPV